MPTLSYEAHYLWAIIQEGCDAVARHDRRMARLATEEIEAMAMHTERAAIRSRAADAVARLQAMRAKPLGARALARTVAPGTYVRAARPEISRHTQRTPG